MQFKYCWYISLYFIEKLNTSNIFIVYFKGMYYMYFNMLYESNYLHIYTTHLFIQL